MVWEAVREDRVRSNDMQSELLVDTSKVFPLLLTSQLPTDILGHIWNLANQKYAGQLTEQELYIVLALVAAAQTSYTFNSLDILHLLPFPPTPYLNIECLMNLQPTAQINMSKFQYMTNEIQFANANIEGKYIPDVKGKTKVNIHGNLMADANVSFSNNLLGKSFDTKIQMSNIAGNNTTLKDIKLASNIQPDISLASSFDESSDEFTEFQSAPIPSVSTIQIWDSKQGSAIGSRLANHNLGVKKSLDKGKKVTAGTKPVHSNIQIRTNTSTNMLYQNKDHSTVESVTDLFPKCAVKNQSKTVILKDTAIRSNESPKDYNNSLNSLASTTETIHLSNDKEILPKMELTPKVNINSIVLINYIASIPLCLYKFKINIILIDMLIIICRLSW